MVMSSACLINRRQAILDTYHKRIKNYNNIDLVFYSDDEDESTNTFKVDVPLVYSYRDNEIKTIGAFHMIRDRFYNNYDWFFFVDDDTFINIPLLNEKIDEFDENYIHGKDIRGNYGNLPYCSGGAGFLISNKIIDKFFDAEDNKTGWSDVNVGLNAQKQGIEIRNSNYFDPSNPNVTGVDLVEDIKNKITYHYVNADMMKKFDSLS